jgi:hypothetical protein
LNVGPGAEVELPIEIDYAAPFAGCDPGAWEHEYLAHVQVHEPLPSVVPAWEPADGSPFDQEPPSQWYESWQDYTEDHEHVKGFVT